MTFKVHQLKTEYKKNPLGLDTAPRFSWELVSERRDVVQVAYRISVASSVQDLDNENDLIWDSGRQESNSSLHVLYNGKTPSSGERLYWRVQVWDNQGNEAVSAEEAWWETGLLSVSDWKAQWITVPWEVSLDEAMPCPYFRTAFFIEKAIASARIYVTALGLYELELNGRKVGDEVFAPGWTNYHKRVQYQVYDVTDSLQAGENAIGAILGDGWYRGHIGWWENNRNNYGTKPALLLQLQVAYQDGTKEVFASDETWKSTTGPLLKSDIYNGETYDSRLEMPGWCQGGYDSGRWQQVKILNHTLQVIVPSEGEKIRRTMELAPVELLVTPRGEKVVDLGQNMTGWVRLKVSGNTGDKVTLHYAEVLDQEGNFYTENLRKIECTDTYILKGTGEETYEPRFTFHGFRYVMVEGYPGDLTAESITGIVVHSDMQRTGSFQCSDALLNQLQSNIEWGQRGNFLDVPTDCPQRDERLGWTGDAQVFAPTASFNFNTARFFTKWLRDLQSEQRADGSVPWVVPNIIKDGGGTGWSDGFGATGWADAAVVIPYIMYLSYGDERILTEQYSSMKAWVDYMRFHAEQTYIFDYGFHFGDWLAFSDYASYNFKAPDYGFAGAHTEKALLSTAYFYHSANILRKTAEILGKQTDANDLEELLPKIKKAWNREFTTETGRLVSGTQTAYAIALVFDLLDEDKKAIVAKRLADDVQYFGHLTTGFLGTPVLNFALSDYGYSEIAYSLLLNERYPSWLYPVTMGATTIWERWDGIRPDGSFQTTGMNSFNHYAYGAIGHWIYSRVAGLNIDPANPGYRNILFCPTPGGSLTYARAVYHSLYGKIVSSWEVTDHQVHYNIEIPANASGTVTIDAVTDSVMVDGAVVQGHDAVKNLSFKNGKVTFNLGSGSYQIEYTLKNETLEVLEKD